MSTTARYRQTLMLATLVLTSFCIPGCVTHVGDGPTIIFQELSRNFPIYRDARPYMGIEMNSIITLGLYETREITEIKDYYSRELGESWTPSEQWWVGGDGTHTAAWNKNSGPYSHVRVMIADAPNGTRVVTISAVKKIAQPEDLVAKVVDAVHSRSLDGLTALIDEKTILLYGSSPGEGGWGAKIDRNSRPCSPAEFIRNLRWDFQRNDVKTSINREGDDKTIAVARWSGRNELGLDATLEVVFRRASDGRWEIQTISLRENCTRTK